MKNIDKSSIIYDQEKLIKSLKDKLERAEEVLKVYSDKYNWNSSISKEGPVILTEEIGGDLARSYFKGENK